LVGINSVAYNEGFALGLRHGEEWRPMAFSLGGPWDDQAVKVYLPVATTLPPEMSGCPYPWSSKDGKRWLAGYEAGFKRGLGRLYSPQKKNSSEGH
jgi:hypothetical protein